MEPETPPTPPTPPTEPSVGLWGSAPAVPSDSTPPPLIPQPKKGYGWGTVIFGLLGAVFFPAIPLFAISVIAMATDPNLTSDPAAATAKVEDLIMSGPVIATLAVFTWLGLLSGVFLAGRKTVGGWKAAVNWGWRKTDIPVGIGVGVGLVALSVIVSIVLKAFGVNTDELGNTDIVTNATGFWLIFMAFGAVIVAPLVEELMFRGVVLKTAVKSFNVIPGLIVTSVIFGLMHIQDTVASSVYTVSSTAAVGFCLGVLALKTKRLGSSIVAHGTFNLLGVIFAVFAGM